MVLEVVDDGAGLNREAIRKRGEERGLIRQDAVLSDDDLDMLIFEPGFSTADEVSRLAGRGVGMDVVASEVRQLGGTHRHPVDAGARARASPCACRRRSRSPRRCSCASAKPRSPCRSRRCAAWAASPREQLGKADAAYQYGGEDYRGARPGQPGRPRARPRPKASCRCRCCWFAPATCAPRSASTRSSATAKSW